MAENNGIGTFGQGKQSLNKKFMKSALGITHKIRSDAVTMPGKPASEMKEGGVDEYDIDEDIKVMSKEEYGDIIGQIEYPQK